MRIAFFSPVSPQKTGVADYSEKEILPYLSKYCDIDVFIDRGVKPTNPYLTKNYDCFSYDNYKKMAHKYDVPVYQMGNNEFHPFIYETLLHNPGITVLHDIFLHGLLWNRSIVRGDSSKYISEFEYCYGEAGVQIAKTAIQTGVFPEFAYPLIKRIVDRSLGVICHSEFGMNKVLTEQPHSICTVIPQPFTVNRTSSEGDLPLVKKSLLNKTKRISDCFPVVSSFGYLSGHKQYNVILSAFKKFLERYPSAVYVIIGQDKIGLLDKISELKLEKNVIITGFMAEEELEIILKQSDFFINLRYPTAGETSRSVLQIMGYGKPVIVSNIGWFSELPNDTCLKLEVDSYQEAVLLDYLTILTENKKIRDIIGINAEKYVIKCHDPDMVAKMYYKYIRNILNGNEMMMNTISRGFVDLGLEDINNELIESQICKIKDLF